MKGHCAQLHNVFSRLKRHRFPFEESSIPSDGIYVLFEKGEKGHGTDRVVRIGTHTGKHLLKSRLYEHFLVNNKDRSIFRKHVGRALLKRNNDPFFEQWEWDLTPSANRKKYASKLNLKKQAQTEELVTTYIQDNLYFVVLPVSRKQRRLEIEAKLIGEVSLCKDCGPSSSWLGKYSPAQKIKKSGLWQIQKVFGNGLTDSDMEEIREIVSTHSIGN
ncbi:MAG: hypothetical protein FJ240_09070 [Nitrospira sp.]|nr:hypothetical protein [Nitrospira sp.]